jgi:hypothetical protein
VSKTPAQSHDDDYNRGDRAETAERLSSRRLLSHFSDHLDSRMMLRVTDPRV